MNLHFIINIPQQLSGRATSKTSTEIATSNPEAFTSSNNLEDAGVNNLSKIHYEFTFYYQYSTVAQWQSNRLLTDQSQVRILPVELIWRCSSAGESVRFIPERSGVRSPLPLPKDNIINKDPQLSWSERSAHNRLVAGSNPAGSTIFNWRNTQVWLKGSVLKTERGVKARGGSNPSSSSIHNLVGIFT